MACPLNDHPVRYTVPGPRSARTRRGEGETQGHGDRRQGQAREVGALRRDFNSEELLLRKGDDDGQLSLW
jgi:hypothetical protein